MSYKNGTVEAVTVSGGTAYLSVDGSLYDAEHLVEVYEDGYLLEQKMPTMSNQYFAYNGQTPENFSFEVEFGEEEAMATKIALIVDGKHLINPEYVRQNKNYFTINQDVFHQLSVGEHTISVMFNNDPYYTTKDDVIEVDVINSEPTEDTDVFLKESTEEEATEGTEETKTEE